MEIRMGLGLSQSVAISVCGDITLLPCCEC